MINFTSKPRYGLDDLIRLVHVLRAPGGCPWDAAQTHLSIRRNFLEEAYEACEALDCDDAAMLREELGDVLLQVLFHADIETGRGRMTIDDIADGFCWQTAIAFTTSPSAIAAWTPSISFFGMSLSGLMRIDESIEK